VRPEAPRPERASARGLAFWVALATGVVTVLTFGLALTALPDKVPYPFTGEPIAAQWPGDYYWMYPAMVLMVLFVALVAVLHERAPQERKLYGQTALALATAAAVVLLIDYYVQVSVMPVSLQKGQLDGWSMLTQYNPNGVFIALEELGYLLMSVVFLCLVPVLSRDSAAERAVRWLFLASFGAVVLALAAVSLRLGTDRGDVFEIVVISVVWLTLIISSAMLAVSFGRGAAEAHA
jgi:hypothetical protein